MKNKDFRELQLSSIQLVFLFLAILILGIFIFLLGVSVGKKQNLLAGESGISAKKEVEELKAKIPVPAEVGKNSINEELTSYQKNKEEAEVKTQKEQPPIAEEKDLYFIQIGAFSSKEAALSFMEKFNKEGYSLLILDPFPSDKKPTFRVRIGSFQTKEEANRAVLKLNLKSNKEIDYFITKD